MKTEKEDQLGVTGQDRDTQQHALDSAYYDEGPSMMPASEKFAGNQDNWGASATDGWSTGNTGTGGADTSDWNPPATAAAGHTGTSGW